ncbi:hypothetical protein [Pseudomonas akapageensis]|uniref:hypothetical protein n=1 Tax=Pseudomonas akapageensis TaxID=2609961 RepID=UPI0014089FF4|nr:hypothetical protein [Pseudomonas akapageensis]
MLLLRTTGVVTAILILPYSGLTYAATWQSAIALPMTVEYDSNPLLLTENEKGVTRTIIAPDYSLVGTSDLDQFRFGLGVNVERSSDSSIVSDREDPTLQLGWQRETERGGYGLTAKYVEVSTLSTAVQETGVVVATDGTQKAYSLGGNWSTKLSERSTLVNETDYTNVKYDIDSLTDYDEIGTRFSLNYAWSERVVWFTRFGVRHYEPAGGAGLDSSDSYTPTTGLDFQISERLEGTLHAGVTHVTGAQSGSSGIGGLLLHYKGERIDTSIDAGRNTIASGDGGYVEVDEARGTWSYALAETSRVGVDASWQDSKGKTPNTLYNYSAWASRELSPFWIARLSLAYKERQQNGLPDANEDVFGVTLIYSHPDF